jgi:hypothetical protein
MALKLVLSQQNLAQSPTCNLLDQFQYYASIYNCIFFILAFRAFRFKIYVFMYFSSPHMCYVACPIAPGVGFPTYLVNSTNYKAPEYVIFSTHCYLISQVLLSFIEQSCISILKYL